VGRAEVAEALAPAQLLPVGVQQPVNFVNGKPELILPSDHTSFTECAEQCFQELASQHPDEPRLKARIYRGNLKFYVSIESDHPGAESMGQIGGPHVPARGS
jgi:hypothetical protein